MKLKLTRTGFDMGYGERTGWHLRDIPKGVIGEVSKIEEELLEYEDACAQQLLLVRAFELSDLIGAIAALLLKRGIPFDLAQPTRRAMDRARLLSGLDFAFAVRQVLPHLGIACDVERIQVLAETLLILIFRETSDLGLRVPDLLAQAQLRSSIAIASTPPT